MQRGYRKDLNVEQIETDNTWQVFLDHLFTNVLLSYSASYFYFKMRVWVLLFFCALLEALKFQEALNMNIFSFFQVSVP